MQPTTRLGRSGLAILCAAAASTLGLAAAAPASASPAIVPPSTSYAPGNPSFNSFVDVNDTVPAGARNLVEGARLIGPLQGFGKMWQKTYRVRLAGASIDPTDVVREWKARFPDFWPRGNQFHAPLTGIAPGEVALIRASVAGGIKLSTGVMVLYADEEAFTLMTPQGHLFAGWITFSSHRDEDGTVAQTQVLMRAQDPLSELGLALGGHRQEDRFWQRTLANLAAHLGERAVVVACTCAVLCERA